MATDYFNGPHRNDNTHPGKNPGMSQSMPDVHAAANEQDKANQEALHQRTGAEKTSDARETLSQDQSRTTTQDATTARAAFNEEGGAGQVRDPLDARDARDALNASIADAGKEVTGLDKGLSGAARAELLHEKIEGPLQATATMGRDDNGQGL